MAQRPGKWGPAASVKRGTADVTRDPYRRDERPPGAHSRPRPARGGAAFVARRRVLHHGAELGGLGRHRSGRAPPDRLGRHPRAAVAACREYPPPLVGGGHPLSPFPSLPAPDIPPRAAPFWLGRSARRADLCGWSPFADISCLEMGPVPGSLTSIKHCSVSLPADRLVWLLHAGPGGGLGRGGRGRLVLTVETFPKYPWQIGRAHV